MRSKGCLQVSQLARLGDSRGAFVSMPVLTDSQNYEGRNSLQAGVRKRNQEQVSIALPAGIWSPTENHYEPQ